MANEDKELREAAERRDDGTAVAGIKLVAVDDDLNFHVYEDGKLIFQKKLPRREATILAYKLMKGVAYGDDS